MKNNKIKKPPHYTQKVELGLKKIASGHHNVSYRNIRCIKSPFDYVLYQMLLFETKPDLVIEIGTNSGGSALYYADLLSLIGKGEVHTIDIVDIRPEIIINDDRITYFSEGWENYPIALAQNYDKILVIDDGSHHYEDVLGVLKKFSPLLKKGDYFIVEDGIVDKLGKKRAYNGGPQRAIKEFLNTNTDFEIDRKWCDFFGTNTTFNTNGYLQKIRE